MARDEKTREVEAPGKVGSSTRKAPEAGKSPARSRS